MHPEILLKQQTELLPYIKNFKNTFYLVGGTAIALHLGHRRSVDFDLFSPKPLSKSRIKKKLREIPFRQVPLFEDIDQLHLLINHVKVTFFHYPYLIEHNTRFDSYITLPGLLTLASMKAFALGRRAKWKDYVDLYFLLSRNFSIKDICREAERNFGNQFSEKLFREQLSFHKDIDFSENVEYMDREIPKEEIMEVLVEKAIEIK